MAHILIVEDEAPIRKFIEINLNREGFEASIAVSGEEALKLVTEKGMDYDVVLLDVNLPGIDGFTTCMNLRSAGYMGIIIMLTARGQDMERIMGLDLGADDYMIKPFNPLELVARIRAFLRRSQRVAVAPLDQIQVFDHLKIDLENRLVVMQDEEVALSPKLFELLAFFVMNPEKPLHRDTLLDGVWGADFFGDYKTVDVHVRRLREKIELDPANPKLIETVWGIGYKWRKAVKTL